MIEVPISIRAEDYGDADGIRRVHETAFPGPLEARLVDDLRRAGRLTVSIVAEIGDEIVGHVAFSPVTIGDSTNSVGLAPLAVLPAYQRQGIGGALIRHGIAACRTCGVGFVVVLGEPAYYRRFGFLPASSWRLTDEYAGGDAFQALELRLGSIPVTGGLVHYAPEFEIFGGQG